MGTSLVKSIGQIIQNILRSSDRRWGRISNVRWKGENLVYSGRGHFTTTVVDTLFKIAFDIYFTTRRRIYCRPPSTSIIISCPCTLITVIIIILWRVSSWTRRKRDRRRFRHNEISLRFVYTDHQTHFRGSCVVRAKMCLTPKNHSRPQYLIPCVCA